MASRGLVVLYDDKDRERAIDWIKRAPLATRVTFERTRRSLPQNAKLWSQLTDVSRQVLHMGRRYPTEIWKCLFMAAWGQEVKFIPALDGVSFVPMGYRSSELSKDEMSELISFIEAWGTERGVIFHDPETKEEADGEGTPPAPNKEARPNAPTLQPSTRAIRATKEPVT